MHKLGINLESVSNISHEDFFKTIKNLGFSATFTDMSFGDYIPEVAELCDRYNIEYSFVHAPFRHTNNIWLDNEEGEQLFHNILNCLKLCGENNVPTAVVHVSSGYTPPQINDLGYSRFKKIVEFAGQRNVNIAFENLRVPEYLTWAMSTFEQYKNVGFCWDIGHENCFTEGIDYSSLYGNKLLCTHIHDNMCEHSGDLHMLPFDGKIDYVSFANRIKKCGYKGALTLEVLSNGKYKKSEIYQNLSAEEFLQKAYNAIEKIQTLINN